MEISPYYGEQPLVPGNVVIRINPEDRKRAQALLADAAEILAVRDEESFAEAKYMAGRLKGVLNEIETGRKATKQPFDSVINAIAETAREVGEPLAQEHKRILGLLNGYVAALEEERKEAERIRRAEAKRIQEEHDRKIREALEAQLQAEHEAREAKDEAARQKARADIQARMLVAAQEQLAKEDAAEVATLGTDQFRKGLVTGGRVDHKYSFRLVDVTETIRAGALRLLRWEIDFLACQDSCNAQLELDPDRDPVLPGIQVSRQINVSIKARSR
jgi:hypothetical protein